jgi:hypothetical protein
MAIVIRYLIMHSAYILLVLSFSGCGLFERDKKSPNVDDGDVGENFELKPVSTEEWEVWYPVPKHEFPKYEMATSKEVTVYSMASPVTDNGEILFGFLEGPCQSIDTRLGIENGNSEVFYKLEKDNHCSLLWFYTSSGENIDKGITDGLSRLVGFATNPLEES